VLRDAFHAPGGAALVLRAFFGVTFLFAGLQKLANPGFFRANAIGSFQSQLIGSEASSPIRPLLRLVAHAPVEIGVLIAISEVAVGLGTLIGLYGRLAALGGMLLSLSFFLSISFATVPYYYGSDIVFVFGWTVLAMGGSGPLSLDARFLARSGVGDPAPSGEHTLTRRAILGRAGELGLAALGTGFLAGLDAAIGRRFAPATTRTSALVPTSTGPLTSTTSGAATPTSDGGKTPSSTTGPTTGTRVLAADSVSVGSGVLFTDPNTGAPAFALQPHAGHFVAFSAVCTHAGCTVGYRAANDEFVCPCHGSVYNAATGAVIQGPAPLPLPKITISESGGELYVAD
jgi:thiosulfate dehydrogenase [quinone] large subunit